jgi:hypothetical protein
MARPARGESPRLIASHPPAAMRKHGDPADVVVDHLSLPHSTATDTSVPTSGTPMRGPHLSNTRRVKAPGGPQCSLGLRAMGLRGFVGQGARRASLSSTRTGLQGTPCANCVTQARLRLGGVSCRVLPRSAISRFANPLVFGRYGQLITQRSLVQIEAHVTERPGFPASL